MWPAATREPLVAGFDLVMLDLDGVVYVGPDAVPGAADAIARVRTAGVPVAYVTNNASRTALEVAKHLTELGMPGVSEVDVVTAAQAVARLVAEAVPAGATVLVVGGRGLHEPLAGHGLRCVDAFDDQVAAVVQGYHPDVGWRDLAEASYAVQAGVPWFASNLDLTVPTPRGIAPGNGALVQVVRAATGAEPVVAGKPERALFDETTGRLGSERPLMVGDRPDTDIDGAIGRDIASLLVLTGVATLRDAAALPSGHRPTFVAPDLGGLHAPHPPVTVEAGSARCGRAEATLDRGTVVLTAGETGTVEAVRAVLGLAWSTADRTGRAPALDGTLDG
ncbi:HAD hydrolase, family IIA [Aeromicrobium marinum DSM 15272]|uniref:HAD hydrolase, family IIA n=1 Tax=Aeromicrobium marinum DSM 15272 TaxID=585531 RepID=E2S9L3_9ACTN|nr:HAD hydrolase, family IIA [Aeromicrobium marinum DSM 15272]